MRRIARHFFETEAEESPQLRALLADAESFFRDTREHRALMAEAAQVFTQFARESLPRGKDDRFSTELLMTTIESVGRSVAARNYDKEQVRHWAKACADMICDQLGFE